MPNGEHRLDSKEPSPYIELDREAWAELGQQADSPLTADEIASLRGLGDSLDLREVEEVYLPISRLLSLHVQAAGSCTASRRSSCTGPPRRARRS